MPLKSCQLNMASPIGKSQVEVVNATLEQCWSSFDLFYISFGQYCPHSRVFFLHFHFICFLEDFLANFVILHISMAILFTKRQNFQFLDTHKLNFPLPFRAINMKFMPCLAMDGMQSLAVSTHT